MDFTLNEDQLAVAGEIDKLAAQFKSSPVDFHGFALYSAELDKQLEDNQFFDIAAMPEMGPLAAALAVERLAQLPYTAEVALSMLLRPALNIELPRPIAVIENGRPGRFVGVAKTLIIIDGDSVGIAHPQAGDTQAIPESLFAYPMAKLVGKLDVQLLSESEADIVRTWLRVACAAEMAGLLKAAIDATVEHISVRKQFGRPLGTLQALRHRMAECAVLAGGVRWLALKAAWSADAGDAALAALHAQESASRVIYDVHQMSGAMGMTLEMDLHLWTYRMKALMSELGGRSGQAEAAGKYCF
ncbi:acyl-CoA dehydrogenase family protein [Zhongshania aquimaris]|uniref:Acyl-CoA dehydrogenase/oxidase C-terminal domain-containing protein n=1 Tax=Zhongshania aquimaris TaxID=2857107 RepID=A0ABS6VXC7_9GAMM|nr:acyl-CoA dehydrogenase family protein [Zhongshania aquimaris]MBW2942668.1 hypothetical protein [Zhongshania aquimaris]